MYNSYLVSQQVIEKQVCDCNTKTNEEINDRFFDSYSSCTLKHKYIQQHMNTIKW